VRYLPARGPVDVGRRMYDAVPLEAAPGVGQVTATVGGHQRRLRRSWGQVRNLLGLSGDRRTRRSAAAHRRAQDMLLPDAWPRVVYAVLDPATGELELRERRHPAPIVATAPVPGPVTWRPLRGGEVMLGVRLVEPCLTVGHRTLAPGPACLFYTEG